jgi:hypothetical protein
VVGQGGNSTARASSRQQQAAGAEGGGEQYDDRHRNTAPAPATPCLFEQRLRTG